MKKIIFIFFFPIYVSAQPLQVQSPVRFLALGDSYTAGQSVSANESWPRQLTDSLAFKNVVTDTLCIIARTGWRTDNLLKAITNRQLEKQHYNLVSVSIGVNNVYQSKPVLQYLKEFTQLLDSAIRFAGGDTSHVFILSLPDYAATPFGQKGNPYETSNDINHYNHINKYFADKYHIRYFDITPISRLGLFMPYLVANDELHPSGLQYASWVKLLLYDNLISVLGDFSDQEMIVYPNVVEEKLTIICPVHVNKTIEIYNSTGSLMLTREMNTETAELELYELNQGIYTIRLVYKGGQVSKKIIKQ